MVSINSFVSKHFKHTLKWTEYYNRPLYPSPTSTIHQRNFAFTDMDLVSSPVHNLCLHSTVSFHLHRIQFSSNHFLKASQCLPRVSKGCDRSDPTVLLGCSQSSVGDRYWIGGTSWGRGCVIGDSPRPVPTKGAPLAVESLNPRNFFPNLSSALFLLFRHMGAPKARVFHSLIWEGGLGWALCPFSWWPGLVMALFWP